MEEVVSCQEQTTAMKMKRVAPLPRMHNRGPAQAPGMMVSAGQPQGMLVTAYKISPLT